MCNRIKQADALSSFLLKRLNIQYLARSRLRHRLFLCCTSRRFLLPDTSQTELWDLLLPSLTTGVSQQAGASWDSDFKWQLTESFFIAAPHFLFMGWRILPEQRWECNDFSVWRELSMCMKLSTHSGENTVCGIYCPAGGRAESAEQLFRGIYLNIWRSILAVVNFILSAS